MLNLKGSVPPNTTCDVIIQNNSKDTAYFGGVRNKGTSLDRKIKLSPRSSLPMSVTTDGNSDIEVYAEDGYLTYTVSGSFITAL